MADIDIRLRMNRRELAILRLVLLEAESQFEAQGRQRFADLMCAVRYQLPMPAVPEGNTLH